MGCCCSTLKPGEEILATEEFDMECSVEQAMDYIPCKCNFLGFDAQYMKQGMTKDEWEGEWPNGVIHQKLHYPKFVVDRTWTADIENRHFSNWYTPPAPISKHVEKFEQDMWFYPIEGQPNKCRFKVQYRITPFPGGLNTWIARKVGFKMHETEKQWKAFLATDLDRYKKEQTEKNAQ